MSFQPIAKRRIALLRSMGRLSDAASALVQLLDFSPTDAEAWSELSDIYLSQGLYPQAIYALEEVLILAPNAWNVCNPSIAQDLSPMLMRPGPDTRAIGRAAVHGRHCARCGHRELPEAHV